MASQLHFSSTVHCRCQRLPDAKQQRPNKPSVISPLQRRYYEVHVRVYALRRKAQRSPLKIKCLKKKVKTKAERARKAPKAWPTSCCSNFWQRAQRGSVGRRRDLGAIGSVTVLLSASLAARKATTDATKPRPRPLLACRLLCSLASGRLLLVACFWSLASGRLSLSLRRSFLGSQPQPQPLFLARGIATVYSLSLFSFPPKQDDVGRTSCFNNSPLPPPPRQFGLFLCLASTLNLFQFSSLLNCLKSPQNPLFLPYLFSP